MKKIIAIVLLLIMTLTGCNMQIIDTQYSFDYAMVKFPNGEYQKIELKSWGDYDGEQLQIIAKDGTVYVVNSVNCVLVEE